MSGGRCARRVEAKKWKKGDGGEDNFLLLLSLSNPILGSVPSLTEASRLRTASILRIPCSSRSTKLGMYLDATRRTTCCLDFLLFFAADFSSPSIKGPNLSRAKGSVVPGLLQAIVAVIGKWGKTMGGWSWNIGEHMWLLFLLFFLFKKVYAIMVQKQDRHQSNQTSRRHDNSSEKLHLFRQRKPSQHSVR